MSLSPREAKELLKPIPYERRIFGLGTFWLMWFAGWVALWAFQIGAGAVPPVGPLNVTQTIVAAILAWGLGWVISSITGEFGVTTGCTFTTHIRVVFGPSRAICWLPWIGYLWTFFAWGGVETWWMALATNTCSTIAAGFDNIWAWFIIFLVIQMIMMAYGFRMLKWFNVGAALLIMVIFGVAVYFINARFGLTAAPYWYVEGSWGLPFWAVVNAIIGVPFLGALFISAFTRHLRGGRRVCWLGNTAMWFSCALMIIIGMFCAG